MGGNQATLPLSSADMSKRYSVFTCYSHVCGYHWGFLSFMGLRIHLLVCWGLWSRAGGKGCGAGSGFSSKYTLSVNWRSSFSGAKGSFRVLVPYCFKGVGSVFFCHKYLCQAHCWLICFHLSVVWFVSWRNRAYFHWLDFNETWLEDPLDAGAYPRILIWGNCLALWRHTLYWVLFLL